jgi:hypothetical protein
VGQLEDDLLISDSADNLYGTTGSGGGAATCGTDYEGVVGCGTDPFRGLTGISTYSAQIRRIKLAYRPGQPVAPLQGSLASIRSP